MLKGLGGFLRSLLSPDPHPSSAALSSSLLAPPDKTSVKISTETAAAMVWALTLHTEPAVTSLHVRATSSLLPWAATERRSRSCPRVASLPVFPRRGKAKQARLKVAWLGLVVLKPRLIISTWCFTTTAGFCNAVTNPFKLINCIFWLWGFRLKHAQD